MRLIDADILVEHLRDQRLKQTGVYTTGFNNATNIAISLVRNPDACPTIEAKPVVRGRQEKSKESDEWYGKYFTCLECHTRTMAIDLHFDLIEPTYCPNCGAKMDGEA